MERSAPSTRSADIRVRANRNLAGTRGQDVRAPVSSSDTSPGDGDGAVASARSLHRMIAPNKTNFVQLNSAKLTYVHLNSHLLTSAHLTGGKKIIFFWSWRTAPMKNGKNTMEGIMVTLLRSLRPFAAIHILRQGQFRWGVPACTALYRVVPPKFENFLLRVGRRAEMRPASPRSDFNIDASLSVQQICAIMLRFICRFEPIFRQMQPG